MKLVIPSKLSEPPKVLEAILDDVKAKGFSDESVFAIRSGDGRGDEQRHPHTATATTPTSTSPLSTTVTDDEFRAEVTDEGCGFCPDSVPGPDPGREHQTHVWAWRDANENLHEPG